jgi:hypothetical protein
VADLSDVADTLVQLIAGVLYPNGTSSPSSVCGIPVRVFAGWPLPRQVQEELQKNIASVSVYPRSEERNTTRYMDEWHQYGCNPTLLNLAVASQTVTVLGQVPPASNPHHVMLKVNGKPYPYLVKPTDTLAGIAAALRDLVAGDIPEVTCFGAVITLPTTANLQAARVGVTQTVGNEVGRQQRVFQITAWANSPAMRTRVAKPVDTALRAMKRFALPDETWARLIYRSSPETDASQKEQVYRRDLFYLVEYATLETDVVNQITQFQTTLTDALSVPIVTKYS